MDRAVDGQPCVASGGRGEHRGSNTRALEGRGGSVREGCRAVSAVPALGFRPRASSVRLMPDLLAARAQMAMSLAFHIIFAVVGIGMPVLMTVAEWRWL